jgi:hypothetical protein
LAFGFLLGAKQGSWALVLQGFVLLCFAKVNDLEMAAQGASDSNEGWTARKHD